MRLREQLELYIREARESIWELRSPTLKSSDLPTAMRTLGERIAGSAVRFELTCTGNQASQAYRVEEALLRIGQEAISNSVRHGRATEVRVVVGYAPRH